ncbi:mono-functional DNA-alkylating methyl methanesulfonate N-term-domain-containing protein [Daldinia caldariorum]|uniref:mono-functional DNA-alkylating methyl methanesulfonate N-term-domain-containing protein n=1 Tax=Daldinia caldariorum TaxID=326644 RepID=UPI0020073B75|nr:mono-functional DNA-alkylating methyl methanesulfonate N-term-domain-containing protein [Daldinia caldariorum]KAI1470467.1 mono-functional DNA-alkylating methyl methanesulfonate N-term-domain-containing protein [Daldinia caldariorum]
MGSPQYYRKASEIHEDNTHVKVEEGDSETAAMGTTFRGSRDVNTRLPPQILILVLERGDLVFLFLQQGPADSWVFFTSTHTIPAQRLICPGFHMAIDPSSNFLVVACSETLFIMFQLHSIEHLQAQYALKQPFQPIKNKAARSVRGIIHKIEFLHPTHGNEIQVIMMVILVQPEISRLAIYEWDSRFDIPETFMDEQFGYRLDNDYRMPLLVVPLKVRNAFLVITEKITATCSNILSGSPVFVQFELVNREDTSLHHGTREPLWTAWTRPIRHPPYHDSKDVIYLAREDGFINFLECGDEFEIETSVSMGSVDCNIDTAFASLFHPFGDILVTGGDSGPGAVWNVQARQSPQRIGSIQNWSPIVDFTLTNSARGIVEENNEDPSSSSLASNGSIVLSQQDKIFACSGRGMSGAITEFRYGFQARIGLDLTYSSNIRQCWAISELSGAAEDGFYLILALPNESAVLHLTRDLAEASEKDHEATPYDLSSTTLAVYEADGGVIQITTNYITIATPTGCSQSLISDVIRDHSSVVAYATVRSDVIALAVYSGSRFSIVLLGIIGLEVSLRKVFDVEGEVTCLAAEDFGNSLVVLAGLQQSGNQILAIYPTEVDRQASVTPILLKLRSATTNPSLNISTANIIGNNALGALTSIVSLGERSGKSVIVTGTRNGDVLTIRFDQSQPENYEIYKDRLGVSPSQIFPGSIVGDPDSVLVCTDAELTLMTSYVTGRQGGHFEQINRVWPTDGDRPSMPSPPINSVASLFEQLPEYGKSTMVMITGPRIMVTELQFRPKLVPRYFPVHGTPVKVLYYKRLEALVTVVSKDGLLSLHFLDPVTGCDLSRPLERAKLSEGYTYYGADYITGLGNPDTRAMSLTTWSYRAGNFHGDWIVLAMRRRDNEGLLLIISADLEDIPTRADSPRRIRFWTKFDRKIRDGPIWSVATDEHGVFLCVGNCVQYHVIEHNKFKVIRQHELPSPASWMQVVNGRLHALTTKHSLVILDYQSEPLSDSGPMVRLHTDDTCRIGLHSIEVRTPLSAITMLSDPMCGIHGLWAPVENERPLSLVFQAELQGSVRRFAQGYIRAPWNSPKKRARYGCLQSSPSGSDIVGLTIDGSLQHFCLLGEDAWRFLRFIQNLAMASPAICPHTSPDRVDDPDLEPKADPKSNMQVDGDILQRCLEKRALEELVSEPQHLRRFQELLEPLDEDDSISSSQQDLDSNTACYELGYSILKYYLSPVL